MKTSLQIQNLKCGGCEATIIEKLAKLNTIKGITVNHENETVNFEHNSAQDIEEVKNQLSKLGYPVLNDKNNLIHKAKSYVSCAIGKTHKIK